MKFLCDVHISYKLVNHLKSLGYTAFHVNDMLDKWFTTDREICDYADNEDFIVVTKDSDFRNSFYIKNTPKKLIKINLGNCSNEELIKIFSENINRFDKLNANNSYIVEVDKKSIQFNLKEE